MTRYDSEKEIIKTIKKNKPWYTSAPWAFSALLLLIIIDTAGFVQGATATIDNIDARFMSTNEIILNTFSTYVMVLAFFVAFEIATLYMAYAFSLKLYQYDRYALRRTSKETAKLSAFTSTTALGWISFAAFILGIIANTLFRLGLMEKNQFFSESKITLSGAITIVMIILPIITSIVNFVIGCFAFDPLLFEMNYLAKRISKAQRVKSNLEEEVIQGNNLIASAKKDLDEITPEYNCFCEKAESIYRCILTRVYEQEIKNINNGGE